MRALLFAAGLIFMATGAQATSRPIVLELFTSEGCSSCPPADALLTSLAGRPDLLPLAFHVTYWNALGWKDPFSSEMATSRQALYAARFGGGSYTPAMVVDGRRAMVGSESGQVSASIAAARGEAKDAVPVTLGRTAETIDISIGSGSGRGRIMLIGFDPRHTTHVGRGENSGSTLTESNIVRSLKTVGEFSGASLRVSVPRGAGADAAVVIQAPDGLILGAARL